MAIFTQAYMGPNGIIRQEGVIPTNDPIKSVSNNKHQEWPIYSHQASGAFYSAGTREIKWISGRTKITIFGASAEDFVSYCNRQEQGESWEEIEKSITSPS